MDPCVSDFGGWPPEKGVWKQDRETKYALLDSHSVCSCGELWSGDGPLKPPYLKVGRRPSGPPCQVLQGQLRHRVITGGTV